LSTDDLDASESEISPDAICRAAKATICPWSSSALPSRRVEIFFEAQRDAIETALATMRASETMYGAMILMRRV